MDIKSVSRISSSQDRWNFFPSVLEGKYGFLLGWFLKLFTRIKLPQEEQDIISSISKESVVVHTLKFKNVFDAIIFHFYYRFKGLPAPGFVFDADLSLYQTLRYFFRSVIARIRYRYKHHRPLDIIESGFAEDMIMNGHASMIFMQDSRTFLRRFMGVSSDPFLFLLKTQQKMERNIFVLPQLIIWEKSPDRKSRGPINILFSGKSGAGSLRRMINLFFNRQNAVIKYSEPVNIQKFLQKHEDISLEESALLLRREIMNRIEKERIIITGPKLMSPQEIIEQVLYDEKVQRAISSISAVTTQPISKTRKKAYKIVKEIAADYNINYVKVWNVILTYVFNNILEGIEVDEEGLAEVRRAARKSNIIVVPSHKSHMDYLIVSYVFYHNNLVSPHIAAGINLAFFPMGYIFRKSGAFFIRRTFRGDDLYRDIFTKYIQVLIKEGYSIEFFIEGGRSRTGRLILPKLGLLSILIDAFQKGYANDLSFIPISVNYDRLMEEKAHTGELTGMEKEKETFSQMFRNRKLLRRRYGKVYVNFDKPLSLKQYLESYSQSEESRDPDSPKLNIRYDFAYHIARGINRVAVVTPFSLTAAAVLATAQRGFSINDLKSTLNQFYDYLSWRKVNLANSIKSKEYLENALRETLKIYADEKKILRVKIDKELIEDEGETLYSVDENLRLNMEYYKNNILHFMLPIAFTSVAILATGKINFSYDELLDDFYAMRNLLTYDFIFPVEDKSRKYLQQSLDYLTEKGFIKKSGDTYSMLQRYRSTLALFAGLIYNYFETYYIVAKTLNVLDKGSIPTKEFLGEVQKTGLVLYTKGVVTRPEALSKVNYTSAINFLISQGVIIEKSAPPAKEGKKSEVHYALTPERKNLNWRRLKRFRQINV